MQHQLLLLVRNNTQVEMIINYYIKFVNLVVLLITALPIFHYPVIFLFTHQNKVYHCTFTFSYSV